MFLISLKNDKMFLFSAAVKSESTTSEILVSPDHLVRFINCFLKYRITGNSRNFKKAAKNYES